MNKGDLGALIIFSMWWMMFGFMAYSISGEAVPKYFSGWPVSGRGNKLVDYPVIKTKEFWMLAIFGGALLVWGGGSFAYAMIMDYENIKFERGAPDPSQLILLMIGCMIGPFPGAVVLYQLLFRFCKRKVLHLTDQWADNVRFKFERRM